MNRTEAIRTVDRQPAHSIPNLPGRLRGLARIELHTGEAVALLNGRKRKSGKWRIYGLRDFVPRIRTVARTARQGDGSSDELLMMVEDRIDDIRYHLMEEGQRLRDLGDERLDKGVTGSGDAAFTIEVWSTTPVVEEVEGLDEFGSQALYCLAQFDDLVRLAKGLRHHDLISSSECGDVVYRSGRGLRGLFAMGSERPPKATA